MLPWFDSWKYIFQSKYLCKWCYESSCDVSPWVTLELDFSLQVCHYVIEQVLLWCCLLALADDEKIKKKQMMIMVGAEYLLPNRVVKNIVAMRKMQQDLDPFQMDFCRTCFTQFRDRRESMIMLVGSSSSSTSLRLLTLHSMLLDGLVSYLSTVLLLLFSLYFLLLGCC